MKVNLDNVAITRMVDVTDSVGLTQGGLLLVAVLAGGDYDKVGFHSVILIFDIE